MHISLKIRETLLSIILSCNTSFIFLDLIQNIIKNINDWRMRNQMSLFHGLLFLLVRLDLREDVLKVLLSEEDCVLFCVLLSALVQTLVVSYFHHYIFEVLEIDETILEVEGRPYFVDWNH